MKGASVKVAILSFFFQLAKKPHHTKSQLSLRPLLPSPNDLRNICKFCFLIICRNVLGQKSGSKPSQRLLHFEKYISFSLKNRTLLLDIFGFKKCPNIVSWGILVRIGIQKRKINVSDLLDEYLTLMEVAFL